MGGTMINLRRQGIPAPPLVAFLGGFDRGEENECWDWVKSLDKDGYGQTTVRNNGKIETKKAHRLAYEFLVGKIPNGLGVLHKCDNRSCCNPSHMFLGTQKENMADRQRKGRQNFGSNHPKAVLTEAQVLSIRVFGSLGDTHQSIADRYSVTRQTVTDIINRCSWKHVRDADGE